MNFEIDGILEFEDSFHEEWEKEAEKFIPVLCGSDYLHTASALVGLTASITSIKLGIYALAEDCETNLYPAKVLHRTLIEHYLKFNYILARFLTEKTDEVGYEYIKYMCISEALSYIKASDVAKSMLGTSTDSQVLKKLKKEHPELNISQKELGRITSKWKHRSIIRYLKGNPSSLGGDNNYLLKLIPEYAELSSFIHGGRSAEEYCHGQFEHGLAKEMYIEVAETCFLSNSIRVHLMLAAIEVDDQFVTGMVRLAQKMCEFIDKYPFHPDQLK
ncbi:hypothetical protein HF888_06845 [Bermanella marisrubri]|uniref:Uncharacterized protein n=1 Tax=Bermanella marisrubri TaxID=207949 RepID=Q1N587_9GAMM|nr:DUF5677 domain-containing protein [Bermanella marisrubri]EAT13191.1 hypothetical protein RED65_00485 [Oceanobacter sp. RED65] [Bermanella marisrubri]QIZ83961.1 hypothetical protein HF888_06845 [Bermanella marisrubri]